MGPEGRTLHVILVETLGDHPTGEHRLYRFDTDGYTDKLRATSGVGATRLFVALEKQVFSAPLPPLSDLKDKDPTALTVSRDMQIPDVAPVPPMRMSRVMMFGRSPAVMRQQDNQTCFYFFYEGVSMVALERQRPFSSGDLWQDLAALGVTRDTPMTTVAEIPWPDGR